MTYAPYPHQQTALDLMEGKDAFALLMAMRTGKTKVLIDDWARTIQAVPGLLVVAPGGVYRTWGGELSKHLPDDLKCHVHIWISGGGKTHQSALSTFMADTNSPRILVINTEALSTVTIAREICKDFLRQQPTMMVIDESTAIKNPAAKRTKFIVQTLGPLAVKRRILSGLPTPRSPLDLFSQFEFLDWRILGFRSFYAFRNRYAVLKKVDFGGRRFDIVVGHRNVNELRERIQAYSYRVTLDQVREAAPPIYQIREVDLTPEQTRLYKQIQEQATTQLESGEHVTATEVIVQILRLHQILCGHVADEQGNLHVVPEKRTAALLEILSDYDGKAIIWCSYDHNIRSVSEKLKAEYGESSVARFWGGNRVMREDEERQFKENPECRFMVATQSAGGRGRTWDMADLHVFFSNSYDLEHRDQAEQRAEGVQKSVQASRIDLIAPRTVDVKILKSLREKINISSAVTGDNWREWVI